MLSLRTVIGALSVSRHCRLGTKGSRSRMHYDINHNFVMQLAGEKQWFLSSLANFTYHGYPAGHSHSRQHYNKNQSLEARDQFPPLAHSPQQYRFTMQAGEVLWCPDHWLHEVKVQRVLCTNCAQTVFTPFLCRIGSNLQSKCSQNAVKIQSKYSCLKSSLTVYLQALTTSVSLNMWFESWGTTFEANMREAFSGFRFRKKPSNKCNMDENPRGCSAGEDRHYETFAQACAVLVNSMQQMLVRLWQVHGESKQLATQSILDTIYDIFCRLFVQRHQGALADSEVDDQGLKPKFKYHGEMLSAFHIKNRIQSAVRKECDDMINHYKYPLEQAFMADEFTTFTSSPSEKKAFEKMVQTLQDVLDVEGLLEANGDSSKLPTLLSPHEGLNELWVSTSAPDTHDSCLLVICSCRWRLSMR